MLTGAIGGLPVVLSHQHFAYTIVAFLMQLFLLWYLWTNVTFRKYLLVAIPSSIAVGLVTLFLYSVERSSLAVLATILQLVFILLAVALAWHIYSSLYANRNT